jgi:hypothetical protein
MNACLENGSKVCDEVAVREPAFTTANVRNKIRESDRLIRESCLALRKYSMVLGWEGHCILQYRGWLDLGYKTIEDYCESLRISRSTFYKMSALAGCFMGIGREQFLSMSIENAVLLANYEPPVRYNPELLDKASTLNYRDFGLALKEMNLKSEKPVRQIAMKTKVAVNEAARSAVETWQREHGIATREKALSLMVAECAERGTIVGFLVEWKRRLEDAIATAKTQKDDRDLRTLFSLYLSETEEMLQLVCSASEVSE